MYVLLVFFKKKHPPQHTSSSGFARFFYFFFFDLFSFLFFHFFFEKFEKSGATSVGSEFEPNETRKKNTCQTVARTHVTNRARAATLGPRYTYGTSVSICSSVGGRTELSFALLFFFSILPHYIPLCHHIDMHVCVCTQCPIHVRMHVYTGFFSYLLAMTEKDSHASNFFIYIVYIDRRYINQRVRRRMSKDTLYALAGISFLLYI